MFTLLEDPVYVSISLHDVDCVFKDSGADAGRSGLLFGLGQFDVDILWLLKRSSGDDLNGLLSRNPWTPGELMKAPNI